MKLSTLIALSSVTAVMWFSVVNNAVVLCSSDTPFRVADSSNESQVKAAAVAKVQLCHVVASFPI